MNKICLLFVSLCFQIGCLHASSDNPVLQWERIRILPSILIEQEHSDNVFREPDREKTESIATISPALKIDWAWTNQFLSSASYRYTHSFYSEYDNFREDQHKADLSFKWHTAKGSYLKIGGTAEDKATQPYAEDDVSKDYYKIKGYLDLSLALSDMWQVHTEYNHVARRFYERIYLEDDYDRNAVKFDFVYRKLPKLPLLLEYDMMKQTSDDADPQPDDMIRHRYHIGARWAATEKIVGDLKFGYLEADFQRSKDVDGFSAEADLLYFFSEITSLKFVLSRNVIPGTRVERDSENYYEYQRGAVTVRYDYFEPLRISVGYEYRQKDFPSSSAEPTARVDRISCFEGVLLYDFKKSMEIMLRYQYEKYDSNRDSLDYEENRFSLGLSFEL